MFEGWSDDISLTVLYCAAYLFGGLLGSISCQGSLHRPHMYVHLCTPPRSMRSHPAAMQNAYGMLKDQTYFFVVSSIGDVLR